MFHIIINQFFICKYNLSVMIIMNKNNRLKPNLLDPIIKQKIIKTLNPVKEDYWEPTKNIFQTFYQKYIRPNIYLILFIIFILLVLLYRYRVIQKDRQKNTEMANEMPDNEMPNNESNEINDYTNLIMTAYNQQKEDSREPPIKKFSERVEPAPIKTNLKNNLKNNLKKNQMPRFAYPIYPYAKGGSLAPAGQH